MTDDSFFLQPMAPHPCSLAVFLCTLYIQFNSINGAVQETKPHMSVVRELTVYLWANTQLCQEKLLCLRSFPCWNWGKTFCAGANLEALSCTVCPWGSVPLGTAEAWPRNTISNINHWWKHLGWEMTWKLWELFSSISMQIFCLLLIRFLHAWVYYHIHMP